MLGAGPGPAPLSRSAPGGVAQGSKDTNTNGQKPSGDAQRKQGIAGHEVPALPHKLYDGIHSGHNGGHPGGHSLSLKPFLLSLKIWLRALESNQAFQIQSLACCLCTNPQYLKYKV